MGGRWFERARYLIFPKIDKLFVLGHSVGFVKEGYLVNLIIVLRVLIDSTFLRRGKRRRIS